MLFSGNIFLYSVVLFLELANEYSCFSLSKFLERSSGRIKFKLLPQFKKKIKWLK